MPSDRHSNLGGEGRAGCRWRDAQVDGFDSRWHVNRARPRCAVEARGEEVGVGAPESQQAAVEADKLTAKVERAFQNSVTKHTAWWSQKLGFARNAQTSAIQNAQPRVEINSGSAPASRNNQASQPQVGGFGFTADRLKQFATQLEQAALR